MGIGNLQELYLTDDEDFLEVVELGHRAPRNFWRREGGETIFLIGIMRSSFQNSDYQKRLLHL